MRDFKLWIIMSLLGFLTGVVLGMSLTVLELKRDVRDIKAAIVAKEKP